MQFADTGVGKIYADLYGTGSFEITCVIVTATIHVIETSMRTGMNRRRNSSINDRVSRVNSLICVSLDVARVIVLYSVRRIEMQ